MFLVQVIVENGFYICRLVGNCSFVIGIKIKIVQVFYFRVGIVVFICIGYNNQ